MQSLPVVVAAFVLLDGLAPKRSAKAAHRRRRRRIRPRRQHWRAWPAKLNTLRFSVAGIYPSIERTSNSGLANELGVTSLSRSRYLQFARYSGNQIYDGGRTWSELCSAAKLSTGANNEPVSDEEYFKRLIEAVEKLGRIPKASERKLYGLNVSKARYRNYSEFIREAVSKGKIVDLTGDYTADNDAPKLAAATLVPIHIKSKDQPRIIPPIPRSSKRTIERTDIDGFPYAPQVESGVVALFAILCSQGVLRWQIIDLNSSKGIDCVCYDEEAGKEIHVELKYLLTRSGWNHPLDDVDYVVCWENRWPDFPKSVFELKKFAEET